MIDNEIYEVSRAEYKSFVETIKPETREIKERDIDEEHKTIEIFSKKTGKRLTSRIIHTAEKNHEPEKYYIFEMPDDDERSAPIPKVQVVLETKEQVQAFLDGMKKMKEMEKEKTENSTNNFCSKEQNKMILS